MNIIDVSFYEALGLTGLWGKWSGSTACHSDHSLVRPEGVIMSVGARNNRLGMVLRFVNTSIGSHKYENTSRLGCFFTHPEIMRQIM